MRLFAEAGDIVNDPNDWCDEHDDPTYIVELIKKVTTGELRDTAEKGIVAKILDTIFAF